MSYCQFCGNELEDGALFCSTCGKSQQTAPKPARRVRNASAKHLHCPNCGSSELSAVVESEISGGMSVNHSFTRKTGVSSHKFNNTHRNYWMCKDCGHKFRNLQNLEEELAAQQKLVKNALYGVILLAVLGIFCSVTIGFGFTMLFLLPVIIIVACSLFVIKGRISKLEDERVYLKQNCFD